MRCAIWVRDYIYTAPRKDKVPRLMVNSYQLVVLGDYAEAAEWVATMRVTFGCVGFNRDYWLVPVEEA